MRESVTGESGIEYLCFNAESDLLESLLHRDTSINDSQKIDSLLDEFAGELTLRHSIPPGIDDVNLDPEGDILFLESLLYDNSSPRPPEEFNSENPTESFSPSPIPVEDSDSLMEEIDIFLDGDKSIPPGIESDDFDSEDDNNSTFLPEFESFHVDYPDSGDSTIDVVEDIPVDVPNILPTHPALQLDFDFIPSNNDVGSNLDDYSPSGDRNKIYDPGICIEVESTKILAPLSPVIDTLLTFSSKNEDKVFNHGVLASKEKSPSFPSHRGLKASKLFHQKSPMLISGDNTPNLGNLRGEFAHDQKETKGKKVVSSLDFQEEVDDVAEQVNTAGELVIVMKLREQREGKAPMLIEGTPKKSKEQILQEEASLAEAIRLDSLQEEERAKQIHLDSLLAQRNCRREEAKLEANAELSKSMLGSELQGEDFAKRMVDLVNQRKKFFAEERSCQAKRKLAHDNHSWVEFLCSNKFYDTKEKVWKEKNNRMARKGNDTCVDKNDSEDSDKVGEQEETVTGTETPINPVPVAMKTPSVATYKIIKQGEKGVYQIVREDGTDIVYINFGAMMKSISRDDLTELYRIVMNRYE
ncbi:hypothetical protein Tco_1516775 [Tanacetum coccineum]